MISQMARGSPTRMAKTAQVPLTLFYPSGFPRRLGPRKPRRQQQLFRGSLCIEHQQSPQRLWFWAAGGGRPVALAWPTRRADRILERTQAAAAEGCYERRSAGPASQPDDSGRGSRGRLRRCAGPAARRRRARRAAAAAARRRRHATRGQPRGQARPDQPAGRDARGGARPDRARPLAARAWPQRPAIRRSGLDPEPAAEARRPGLPGRRSDRRGAADRRGPGVARQRAAAVPADEPDRGRRAEQQPAAQPAGRQGTAGLGRRQRGARAARPADRPRGGTARSHHGRAGCFRGR